MTVTNDARVKENKQVDFHVVARQMWSADQIANVTPLERRDWSGATIHEKLAYEKQARDFLAKAMES